jgi:hypothetical protein
MSEGSFNKLRADNHGFKATTLAPVNQKIRVQLAGLTCLAMPENQRRLAWDNNDSNN